VIQKYLEIVRRRSLTAAAGRGRVSLRAAWQRGRAGFMTGGAIVVGVAIVIGAVRLSAAPPQWTPESTQWVRYLGVYEPDAPGSYSGIDNFAQAIDRQPNLVSYYSTWSEPFQVGFASSAEKHGAITLVQIDARNVSLESIANGRYDGYLRSYAAEIKAFHAQVILSFDHEMNGQWYSWGYKHAPAGAFVAAWRHIVNIFRQAGARNVTWLWTINVVDTLNDVTAPAPWWPGKAYVNWVGIDGYYYSPSTAFASLFGPTIAQVREITRDPILIAETGATSTAGQSGKIADLFAGVRTFGLMGFLLFDDDGAKDTQKWRLGSSTAFATLRQDAKKYMRAIPASGHGQSLARASRTNDP
jgi:mannan endo-1,4-beta-mannosidase